MQIALKELENYSTRISILRVFPTHKPNKQCQEKFCDKISAFLENLFCN